MWPNFRAAGMQCLILSGYVDTPAEVREYTELLPDAAFTLCRLRAEPAELKRRFIDRGWRPDLADEAVAEAEALDRSDIKDMCVETDGTTVSEVARIIREQVGGWPRATPAVQPSGLVAGPLAAPVGAAPTSAPVPVLWLCGATAVGKSTVGYEVYSQVVRAGVPAAYVDLKQIGALRPAADDDPGHHHLKAHNLAAIWAGHREAGARFLVVSGDADRDETVRSYANVLPGAAALTVCRLHAGPAALAERVAQRGGGHGPAIPGDGIKGLDADGLHRIAEQAAREAAALELAGAGDLRVDTDGRSVHDVVGQIRALLGGQLVPSSPPFP
ncbi:hypothetical protein OG830_03285 [Streptomyces sp. NBC_00121]|uniref:hypothetical protein n=1 Tax=unclassified Streptomyces TaxID=2593676 RepID=UPI002DD8412D|nr:hypothetical protein [Streptomyces sp. NBC_01760]WSC67540.1 hypothetical protein OG807_03305 [Streptomyces sp. NBC_01760]WTI85427.1 hypothetical protein OHB17_03890 [Streptomyces sp. NBC_00724]